MVADAPARGAEPRCPRCEGAELGPFPLPSGADVRRCASCRGLWCDRRGLAELLEVGREHPLIVWESPAPARTNRACPHCGDTCLFAVRPGNAADLAVGHCVACDGIWVDGGALPRLRALAAEAPRPRALPLGETRPVASNGDLRFSFDTPLVNGLALPLAFLGALLAHGTMLRLFFSLFANMPLHEVGHATAAWFSGHFAVPLPLYTSMASNERSLIVVPTLTVALLAAMLAGKVEERRYLVWLGGGALVVQAVLTFVVPNWQTLRLIVWSGCGGEIVLGTLLVVSFYYRMPDRLRWDFVRYAALAFGAYALVHAVSFWLDVSRAHETLPYGSALGGEDDANGDMNRLVGWGTKPEAIAAIYLRIGIVGLAIVAGHYVVFLGRALRSRRRAV